jgi:large conductance mechanosensitive channel
MWNDFKAFINKGNVIELAVAFILGGAFAAVVTSLVKDIIMPIVSLATGGVNFAEWFISRPELPDTRRGPGSRRGYAQLRTSPQRPYHLPYSSIHSLSNRARL